MPTISQLPAATFVKPSDEVPLSQSGSVCSVAVGTLLASTQPAIMVQSPALLGRTSLGPGGPEQVNVGVGLSLLEGTVVATGMDHATFPMTTSLVLNADLVISNQGSQMLMPVEALRELFSAGQNIDITASGTISAINSAATSFLSNGSLASTLSVIGTISADDLVPVSQLGTECAISYSNFLNGLTINQASLALPVSSSDTLWVAQDSGMMRCQNFGAVWTWIVGQISTYEMPIVEVTNDVTLNAALHNGRLLICSKVVTVVPSVMAVASCFRCQIINLSSGDVKLHASFISSSGTYVLGPQQRAEIYCFSYSGGTIAYADVPQVATVVTVPGQVTGLSVTSISTTSIWLSWHTPSGGGLPSFYLVSYRQTGASAWTTNTAPAATTFEVSGLQSGTSYDFEVQAVNGGGTGPASQVLTALTTVAVSANIQPPSQVGGVTAIATSSTSAQLSWSNQIGVNAASSYMIQYRATGSSSWITLATGVTTTGYGVIGLLPSTSYDFTVAGVNAGEVGVASTAVSVFTSAVQASLPMQVTGLVASAISGSAVQLSWASQIGGVGSLSYVVQYRTTGSTSWTHVNGILPSSYTVTGLTPSTSYDFSVVATNATGSGPVSASTSAVTEGVGTAVSSISWNVTPSGVYASTVPTLAVNVFVSPSTAPVQFGFSTSANVAPVSWTTGISINSSSLWGAYVPTPTASGSWYTWAQGTNGSSSTICPTSFTVEKS